MQIRKCDVVYRTEFSSHNVILTSYDPIKFDVITPLFTVYSWIETVTVQNNYIQFSILYPVRTYT